MKPLIERDFELTGVDAKLAKASAGIPPAS